MFGTLIQYGGSNARTARYGGSEPATASRQFDPLASDRQWRQLERRQQLGGGQAWRPAHT